LEAVLLVGSTVGPYQILEKLGAGGMGEVFLGHDPRLQRRVALKCLLVQDTQSDELHARVLREARAAARLNHPHIAAVYDVLEQDRRTFIVMEYVEGISLAAHLAAGPLPAAEVRHIGRQLASALAAAHAQGVIHRDLKPANIHVGRDGSIKVLDFGVAKLSPLISPATGTTAGQVMDETTLAGHPGTPVYMAPEQLFDRPIDARADIYSAGVILFLMATGRRPYLETTAVTLAMAMTSAPPPAAHMVNPLVPLDLSATIAKALERDPDKRVQSAVELEAALTASESAVSTTTAVVTPRDQTTRTFFVTVRPKRWKVAAAAVLLVMTGVVAWRPAMVKIGWPRATPAVTRPAVLALLPVDNPGGDPQVGYLGAGIASVVAENFGSIPGLTVLPRAAAAAYGNRRNDLRALQTELGADYVVDLALRTVSPRLQLVARLRRPRAATPDWEQTIDGDPLEVERTLLQGMGHALETSGALPRPLKTTDWDRIRRLPTTSGEALMLYSEARALLDRFEVPGNVDRAIGLLDRATAADPRFAVAFAALGDAYWDKYLNEKDPALVGRATDAVLQAIRLDPDQAAVHYSLGNMQFLTGRPEDAANSLRRSLALQPDSDEAHRLLGQVLADRGDVEAGVAEVRQAIRIRPSYWRNYMTLGLVYYRAGRLRDALEPYRRATELAPTEASPFANLGTVYHRLGDIDQAIGNYEHAVRLGPSASAFANLALAYYNVKRYDDALHAYREALTANPKSVLNHRNIGDVYQRLGQTANAKAEYEQAIAIGNELVKVNARDFRTIGQIALCEAKLGRTVSAERHAAEARALGPTDRETLQRSAEVHAHLGNTAAAMKDLEAAIARGYPRQDARENDELVALRTLPAFVDLVGRAETTR
jgi:tetratricopeptide (TPR) repeat protein